MPEGDARAAKTLVAVYSRDGHTRRVAERVAARLGADLAEIRPEPDRFRGLLGLVRAVVMARRARPAPIAPLARDPADYDLVVVATPIWANHIAPPVRAFLAANRDRIRDYATLYTCGGTGLPEAGEDMARVMGPSPRAVLDLVRADLDRPAEAERIETFARELGLA